MAVDCSRGAFCIQACRYGVLNVGRNVLTISQALASVGNWEALRKFGAEKKSPIGYKPFALACMRHKSSLLGDDTERYIDGYIERVKVLIKIELGVHRFLGVRGSFRLNGLLTVDG